jgi:hypothetical protein
MNTPESDPYEADDVAAVTDEQMASAQDAPDEVKQEFLQELDDWEKRGMEELQKAS